MFCFALKPCDIASSFAYHKPYVYNNLNFTLKGAKPNFGAPKIVFLSFSFLIGQLTTTRMDEDKFEFFK